MDFPVIPDSVRLERLRPPTGRIRCIIDTDAYNEVDDQFAITHALLSPDRLDVEAIYAAPFLNERSTSPADGMEKSHKEILRVLDRLERSPDDFVFRGATDYLTHPQKPFRSQASLDLVKRAMANDVSPLYVVAIGAITNVASALLLEPAIIQHVVVVWLGGHARHWPHTREFNLMQDAFAARIIFDSGVPLVHIPCHGVASHLLTTVCEIEQYVQGRGRIGDYLAQILKAACEPDDALSRVIWDMAATGYLINDVWVPTEVVPSPIVTDELTWDFDNSRHLIRSATIVHRDLVFRDLFSKLETLGVRNRN